MEFVLVRFFSSRGWLPRALTPLLHISLFVGLAIFYFFVFEFLHILANCWSDVYNDCGLFDLRPFFAEAVFLRSRVRVSRVFWDQRPVLTVLFFLESTVSPPRERSPFLMTLKRLNVLGNLPTQAFGTSWKTGSSFVFSLPTYPVPPNPTRIPPTATFFFKRKPGN